MRTTHAMAMTTPMNAPADRRADVVLIVDDVPDNLAVLHDTLDESGYTVLVALDGESALQRAEQSLPDIVLLDAMMPGIIASNRITSGWARSARSSALGPSVATSTV